jgi:hypothetical protein
LRCRRCLPLLFLLFMPVAAGDCCKHMHLCCAVHSNIDSLLLFVVDLLLQVAADSAGGGYYKHMF